MLTSMHANNNDSLPLFSPLKVEIFFIITFDKIHLIHRAVRFVYLHYEDENLRFRGAKAFV